MSRSKKDRGTRVGRAPCAGASSGRKKRRKEAFSAGARQRQYANAPMPRPTQEVAKSRWAAWLKSKRPVLRFLGLLGLLVGAFYTLYVPFTQSAAFRSYLALVAKACGPVLRVLDQDVTVEGPSILSPHFSFEVITGCDGLEMIALFVAAVVALPVPLRSKLLCVLVGTVILMVINLLRIVSLFCVGVYFPDAVDVIHLDAWPGLLMVLLIFSWLFWAHSAMRRGGSSERVSV